MSDYTPSLEEAREQYWAASGDPRRDSGAWGEFDRMIETVRAEAVRSARDELGVYVGDEDSDWWDGYRNGQRRQNTALGEYADRIEREAGLK